MVLNLSDADRKELEEDLAAAEPYDEDDPALNTFDGKIDYARFRATMAKKFLAMDKKQREEQNDQNHP